MEEVILVDELDNATGTMEKLAAHQQGVLHRAFSVLVFNTKGELLLQQRALNKYHSGGLWTNTCCSHPRPGEAVLDAANRKLQQEMGFTCPLSFSHKFIYHAVLDNNLIEHEYDSVLIGHYEHAPVINTDEVMDWKFVSLEDVQHDVKQNPQQYTWWFKQILRQPEIDQLKFERA